MSSGLPIDRETTAPFLVKLFYKTGSFHRPETFASSRLPQHVPQHVSLHTWADCTLEELALEIASSAPEALPSPAIGTRLVFRLACPDLRSTGDASSVRPRFVIRNLGSVVIGEGGPGTDTRGDFGSHDVDAKASTLDEARFVVGDYISCAILPPLSDGSVAPASIALRSGGAKGPDSRGPASRSEFPGHNGSHYPRDRRRGGMGDGFPRGDWKRGDVVPGRAHPRPDGWNR